MFKRLTNASVALVQKYLPDAFIFAVILTILTFVLSFITTGQGIMGYCLMVLVYTGIIISLGLLLI